MSVRYHDARDRFERFWPEAIKKSSILEKVLNGYVQGLLLAFSRFTPFLLRVCANRYNVFKVRKDGKFYFIAKHICRRYSFTSSIIRYNELKRKWKYVRFFVPYKMCYNPKFNLKQEEVTVEKLLREVIQRDSLAQIFRHKTPPWLDSIYSFLTPRDKTDR